MKRWRLGIVLAVSAACDPGVETHVERGSTRDSLVFHAFITGDSVGGGGGVHRLTLTGCRTVNGTYRPILWEIVNSDASPRTLFRYGATPTDAWRVRRAATPLKPGCYRLEPDGAGIPNSTTFVIDSAGGIHETESDLAPTPSRWVVTPRSAGPLQIGMSEDSAIAVLGGAAPAVRDRCYYLPAPPSAAYVMIENGRVARIDVRDSSIATDLGARVGDSVSAIERLYARDLRRQPHKYIEGEYLIVPLRADTAYQLIFETDRSRVTTYRAGRLPAVAYVEGCS
jgi:hypothetical protein